MFDGVDGVLCDLMEGLFHIAVADGDYHPNEDAFLERVAQIFGLPDREFRALRSRFVPDAEPDPYSVLNLPPDATLAEARKAWRQMVHDTHPDKMMARGLPEEAVKLAENRLIAINRAWEQISGASALMRIATYNVEWFNNLFADDGALLADGKWSGRQDVTREEQLTALGIVFTALDADAVMIIEAPDHNGRRSTTRALETFAEFYRLRTRKALTGFDNDTQQEIALLLRSRCDDRPSRPQGRTEAARTARTARRVSTAPSAGILIPTPAPRS